MLLRVVQIDPADGWRWDAFDSLLVAEFFEQHVDVREVVCGHVFDKGAHEFVIADAPVDPAEEENELHQRRDGERPGVRFEEFEHLGSVGFSLRRRLMGALVCERRKEKERVLWIYVGEREEEKERCRDWCQAFATPLRFYVGAG